METTTNSPTKKPQTLNKRPQPKHKLLLKEISGNLGKGETETVAVGKAMRKFGYSDSYADNPQQLTKTKSWIALMQQHLPDELLAEKHHELLQSRQVNRFIFSPKLDDLEITEIVNAAGFNVIVIRKSPMGKMAFYSVPNIRGVERGLDMGYKLKNRYAPETMNLKFAGYDKKQLIDLILRKLKKK